MDVPLEVFDDRDAQDIQADLILKRIDHLDALIAGEASHQSRWLSGSLLLINSAGLGAFLNSSTQNKFNFLLGSPFALGVVFALLSGVILQEVYNNMSMPMLNNRNYWINVRCGAERDPDIELQLKHALENGLVYSKWAPISGWVSGLLFVPGCSILGYSFQ